MTSLQCWRFQYRVYGIFYGIYMYLYAIELEYALGALYICLNVSMLKPTLKSPKKCTDVKRGGEQEI